MFNRDYYVLIGRQPPCDGLPKGSTQVGAFGGTPAFVGAGQV
jgi:hypothetical protein